MRYESTYIASNLRHDIVNDDKYRSNPMNYFHYEYQSSVNRIFATFIILMLLAASISIFGGANTFIGIVASLVCAAMVSMVSMVSTILIHFWHFLSGR